MERHGKPSADILGLKEAFFRDNDRLLEKALRIAESYASQPARPVCKNCAVELGPPTFTKHGVSYTVCPRCEHLNGVYEDTDAFTNALYTDDGGASYSVTYDAESAEAFRTRVQTIYAPKAQFLFEALSELGEDPRALRYADFGAGSGYFVSALVGEGAERVRGFEVSDVQVQLANQMVAGDRVRLHAEDEIIALAQETEAEVVSMIGVLEHVRTPREVVAALRSNPVARFVYISVPTFSLSSFIEMGFADIFPRHLSSAHTHLYTDASLRWLEQEFGLERVAQWWFGTDLVDLFRSLTVTLGKDEALAGAAPLLDRMLLPALDEMQVALDQRHLGSEVHVLWRVS